MYLNAKLNLDNIVFGDLKMNSHKSAHQLHKVSKTEEGIWSSMVFLYCYKQVRILSSSKILKKYTIIKLKFYLNALIH